MRPYFPIFLIFSGLLWLAACSDSGTPPEDTEFIFPDSNISFVEHIQPMFIVKCGTETGCHSPADIENPLNYTVLINRSGILNHFLTKSPTERLVNLNTDPANPELSPLYLILFEGYPRKPEDRMPPLGRQPINVNQLDGIAQWIREGAPQ